VCRELKIYGQWISGGQRRLSRVANLSNHLSFVGVLLGSIMGLKERLMFFSVGLAHYMLCSAMLRSTPALRYALLCSSKSQRLLHVHGTCVMVIKLAQQRTDNDVDVCG